MEEGIKIYSRADNLVSMRIYGGHFATPHSHINYYIDMTNLKARQNEAEAAARVLAARYSASTVVDTIICLDGCEIIGAYLAQDLSQVGTLSMNMHKTIYIAAPEAAPGGQLIFRENMQHMIRDKNVVLLFASATTGETIKSSLECVLYYGGRISGIASIFSAITKIGGLEVNSIFTEKDIPDYKTYPASSCPMCREGRKLDAMVNNYGYSKL